MTKVKDPGNFKYLDEEERELSESVERGEWRSVSEEEKDRKLKMFRIAIDNTFDKMEDGSLVFKKGLGPK